MTSHWISIATLCLLFFVAKVWPVNMGVLAFVGAFLVGTLVAGMSSKEILSGFPTGLFLTLVGITYLFAVARTNGTIDWLVQLSVRAVQGRIATIPWIMFVLAATLTGLGAVSPAAVAIIAPMALGFARRYQINPLLMGLLVIHGAQAGGFSPISIYGGVTNSVVEKAGLPVNALWTCFASLTINLMASILLFLFLDGRSLLKAGGHQDELDLQGTTKMEPVVETSSSTCSVYYRMLTLLGVIALATLVLVFQLDLGLTALTIGLALTLVAPHLQKDAIQQVSWSEILLVTGVGTYVFVLERMGTIAFIGIEVAGMSSPLMASLILCFIGAVVSAFASSTAVLGSLIPLAVPFLQSGTGIDPVGFIAAMAVASTIVDVSPFSTNGAIVLASAKDLSRDLYFRRLMAYSLFVTLLAPIVVWLIFVVIL